MDVFAEAMDRLRTIRDALNNADLVLAGRLLVEHDRLVREVFEASPPTLAVSEAEALQQTQLALLEQLRAVQDRVERESQQARRGGAAARAYLGNAGG